MHVLVVANETVTGRGLIEAIERRRDGDLRVTVLCPVNQPEQGYVVYQDTRRAAAGRRLDKTLKLLHDEGISAHGLVVESDPVTAVRDALAQLEPRVDEVIVATHPLQKSGWLRRNVVDRIRGCAGDRPVEHVVVDIRGEAGEANVLVIANETVLGEHLLGKIKERADQGPASFLIVSPQSDPDQGAHPEADRRLRRVLAQLRSEGIEAHGQVAHPDPFTAAMHAVRDESIDAILVSTFPEQRGSSWLRRDLIGRLTSEANVPVEHVVVEPSEVGA